MNCFIKLLYFGVMANLTLIPNTTSTCSSNCVTDMCQLSKNVPVVCFTPSTDYIETVDLLVPILSSIILFLTMYSIIMTFTAWYHWRNRY